MNKELQDRLYEKYPKLFGQRSLPMSQTAMCWGLEVGNGWFFIIDKMCENIQSHIKRSRHELAMALVHNRRLRRAVEGNDRDLRNYYDRLYSDPEKIEARIKEDIKRKNYRPLPDLLPQLEFTQVKEKYGGLRAYTTYVDDYIDGVINMAESMSYVTCEVCGNPGEIRGSGWYYTACDEHTDPEDILDSEQIDEEAKDILEDIKRRKAEMNKEEKTEKFRWEQQGIIKILKKKLIKKKGKINEQKD